MGIKELIEEEFYKRCGEKFNLSPMKTRGFVDKIIGDSIFDTKVGENYQAVVGVMTGLMAEIDETLVFKLDDSLTWMKMSLHWD